MGDRESSGNSKRWQEYNLAKSAQELIGHENKLRRLATSGMSGDVRMPGAAWITTIPQAAQARLQLLPAGTIADGIAQAADQPLPARQIIEGRGLGHAPLEACQFFKSRGVDLVPFLAPRAPDVQPAYVVQHASMTSDRSADCSVGGLSDCFSMALPDLPVPLRIFRAHAPEGLLAENPVTLDPQDTIL